MVVVDFWATWCAPCLVFAEVFAKVAQLEPSICFVKMNIGEASSEVMETLGIQSIPHLMIFKKGVVVYSESGTLPQVVLHDLVNQTKILEID
jgi:thioredoxin 1